MEANIKDDDQTKFHFFVDVGTEIGLGHYSRVLPLLDSIKLRGYNIFLHAAIYGEDNIDIDNLPFKHQYWLDIEEYYSVISNNDVVLVDSYRIQEYSLNLLLNKTKFLYVFSDLPDSFLNQSFKYILPTIRSRVNENTCTISGFEFYPISKEFSSRNLNINNINKSLVISLGSVAKPCDYNLILDILSKTLPQSFKIFIFHNEPIELNKYDFDIVQMSVSKNENYVSKIQDSEFVISAGGVTAVELLAIGKPNLFIQTAENQRNNIKDLCEIYDNEPLVLGSSDFSLHFKLLIKSFINTERLITIRERLLKFDFSNSLDNLVTIITNGKPKLEFRRASIDDSRLLFNWVNEGLVRSNSFNSGLIDYHSHQLWLANKLNDESTFIYIAIFKHFEVGQVRIENELSTHNYIIDYSIDKCWRGRRLGLQILRKLEEVLINEFESDFYLLGRVKFENLASQKTFESLGYDVDQKLDYYEYRKVIRV